MRLRIGRARQPKGSILLFSGRSEYLEKYGRVARDVTAAGYDILSLDWRGQGFSDRLAPDPRVGHVESFTDYQQDVAALVASAKARDLPKPWYLVGHSMGGCIGLRALIEDLPVQKAVFSAPMWGIFVFPRLRPVAKVLPELSRVFGQQMRTMPGTSANGYVTETAFASNLLTTDRDTWDYLARQGNAVPEFALGGPTIHWFDAARRETSELLKAPRPSIPVRTMAGTREGIIDRKALVVMHNDWPSARLHWITGARHELMMEAPKMRQEFLDRMLAFFDADG